MRISDWSSDVCSSDLPHSDNPLIIGLLDQQKIPFARIGSRGGAAGNALTMDDEGSARRATRHLIDLGHKRIGFIGGSPEYSLDRWRIDDWTGGKGAAGLAPDRLHAQGRFPFSYGA